MKKHREIFLEIRKYICKRCLFKFFNNIKLYQHVQNHYQKKFKSTFFEIVTTIETISTFNQIVSSLFNEIILFSKSFVISSFISLFTSFLTFFIILFNRIKFILFIFIEFILFAIFFATSKKQISWAKIISKFISSRLSRLSRFASKIQLISISSLSTRFYITMNNLFVIFNEKTKSLNLSHRQKNKFFSCY